MRKKLKNEIGITLIALVITIIVLLILAGLAISMLSGKNGILKKAAEAKTKTEQAQTNEEEDLTDLEDLIYDNVESVKNLKDYVGKKVEGRKVRLQDENGEIIVVPVGFTIKSDSPIEVKKGVVVVAPDNSEFVWIPVKDISKMYGINAEKNKLGKIYEFTASEYTALNWTETDGIMNLTNKDSYREPDYLKDKSNGDAVIGDSTKGVELLKSIVGLKEEDGDIITQWKTNLQNEFDNMIKYVAKNKGFYVGRYETSLNSKKIAQSISGVASATTASNSANTWYGLYQKEKEYSIKNNLTNIVVSSMIWGSQYDQMMMWMQGNGIDVTSTTPKNLEGVTTSKNTTRKTGTVETDKVDNIYDLLGNSHEWTLEVGCYASTRVTRGGDYYGSASLSSRINTGGPHWNNSSRVPSSRITLYVK